MAFVVRRLALAVVWFIAVAGAARADDAFFMPVEDVFYISGIGVVATGTVVRGTVQAGGQVDVVGLGRDTAAVTVLRIDQFSKAMPSAGPGDNVGLFLRGVEREDVERGQALVAPGTLQGHTQITAEIAMLAEGGRKTPVADGYRPLLKIYTHSVSATVDLGGTTLAPGGKATARIALEEPAAVQAGDVFAVTEGGRVVGSGTVVSVED